MPKKKETGRLQTFYQAIGRRKTSTARVRLYPLSKERKTSEIIVNDRSVQKYFPGEIFSKQYLLPFKLTDNIDRFVVTIKVNGGGLTGQLGAVVHGIARALCKVDENYRPILKKQGLLTRDPRMKERRKAGLAGKARAAKQSPKR